MMAYNGKKTAVKGGNEAMVLIVSSAIAAYVVPFADTIGIDIDPTILAGAVIVGLGTLGRVFGNWLKHRKDK